MIRNIYLTIRAIPKTIFFNFKYLPFKQAIKFPVLISHRVWLMKTKGKITIETMDIKPAMIKIGFGEIGIFDAMRARSVWNVGGLIEFKGKADFRHGVKIAVGDNGTLYVGNDVVLTAESTVMCNKEIVLEDMVGVSWESQIMDTDFHPIYDKNHKLINGDEKVVIGAGSWIGSRVMILKGVNLPPRTMVAAGTLVSKASVRGMEGKEGILIGGNPVKILKEDITFSVRHTTS
ncbi:MAG: hypothetical protein RR891_03730 [Clostridium sp.]